MFMNQEVVVRVESPSMRAAENRFMQASLLSARACMLGAYDSWTQSVGAYSYYLPQPEAFGLSSLCRLGLLHGDMGVSTLWPPY